MGEILGGPENPEPLRVFQSDSLKSQTIGHGFFGRQGGRSTGIFTSLNCGNGSGDNPEAVRSNQQKVSDYLLVKPDHLLTLYQMHSAEVINVDQPWDKRQVFRAPGRAYG